MKYILLFIPLILFSCTSSKNKALLQESYTLYEQSEDSILNFSQKCYEMNIDDPSISHNIDVALKYSRLQEDYNDVMSILDEQLQEQ